MIVAWYLYGQNDTAVDERVQGSTLMEIGSKIIELPVLDKVNMYLHSQLEVMVKEKVSWIQIHQNKDSTTQ